jgi:hypothetical protein
MMDERLCDTVASYPIIRRRTQYGTDRLTLCVSSLLFVCAASHRCGQSDPPVTPQQQGGFRAYLSYMYVLSHTLSVI